MPAVPPTGHAEAVALVACVEPEVPVLPVLAPAVLAAPDPAEDVDTGDAAAVGDGDG